MSGRDAGETGAGKADGPEATPRGQTFVQELVPRRRDATSNVRRRARPGRERRRAKPRTLQGEIEDDLDVSLAESAVKSSRDNIVFDNDDDDMQDRDDDDDDDDDDVHDDFFRDDEEQDEQDEDIASESDDDAPTKEVKNASPGPNAETWGRPAAQRVRRSSPVLTAGRGEPARSGKRPRPAASSTLRAIEVSSANVISTSSSSPPLSRRFLRREHSIKNNDDDSSHNSSEASGANNLERKRGQSREAQRSGKRASTSANATTSGSESDSDDNVERKKKQKRQEEGQVNEEDDRREERAVLKPVKERLTCLDIVHNLASVLVDEYAEELEQRGRPEYAVFLDRFLAEIRSEFAVYNTLAHEFASHSRFSRALTRELQDLREKLAWMQKQRIRAERLVSAKRAELAHREASKKEDDAASAYLARLQPSSQRR